MKLFFTTTLLFLAFHLTAQYHFCAEDDRTYANDKNTLTDIPLLPDSNKKSMSFLMMNYLSKHIIR